MGNDVHAKAVHRHVVDGKAYAVYGNRTFFNNVPQIFGRDSEGKNDIARLLPPRRYYRHTVDMAGHDMPAEPVRQPHSPLKVHLITGSEPAKPGSVQGFRRHIEREERTRSNACHGKTCSVHCHRVADLELRRRESSLYGKPRRTAAPFKLLHLPDIFNQPCEHSPSGQASTRISAPTLDTFLIARGYASFINDAPAPAKSPFPSPPSIFGA